MLTLYLAYLNKARCAGPPFDSAGRSLIFNRIKDSAVCYSDIQFLWLGRGIDQHLIPYVDGGLTSHGVLFGGAVEYPVLSGALMWLGAFCAHTDADFLRDSALLLAPFALVTAWMLSKLSGRTALLWSAGPPLVLYSFHNWELPVVCSTVVAIYLMSHPSRLSLRTRGTIAATVLGIGCCLKLYPGLFIIPLALRVALHRSGRLDLRSAGLVVAAGAATVIAINLPFALAGYSGWAASFQFQSLRRVDITTNSVWYWGIRRMFPNDKEFQNFVDFASPALIGAACLLAIGIGLRHYRKDGNFPWIGVSGAMLCGFLLLHKVHSPQYTLWLIPFLVLLSVPWQAIVCYLVADAAVGIGVFRYFHDLATGQPVTFTEPVVQAGIWGQAIGLVYFFFAVLSGGERSPIEFETEPDPLPTAPSEARPSG